MLGVQFENLFSSLPCYTHIELVVFITSPRSSNNVCAAFSFKLPLALCLSAPAFMGHGRISPSGMIAQ